MNDLYDVCKSFEFFCLAAEIEKMAVVRKLPSGKYQVQSEKGKNLGTYTSRKDAEKRLKQVEFFKFLSQKDKNKIDDGTFQQEFEKLESITLSSVMRCINKTFNKEIAIEFLKHYKKCFDYCLTNKKQNIEENCLRATLKHCFDINLTFNTLYKSAARQNLGDPKTVGKYLSDVIKFNMLKISPENRGKSINRLKSKIYYMNENEISAKKMPASSAIGSSITFVKHLLFNNDPHYIRQVLNNIVRNL